MSYSPKRGVYKGQKFETEYQYKKFRIQTEYGLSTPKHLTLAKQHGVAQRFKDDEAFRDEASRAPNLKKFIIEVGQNNPNRILKEGKYAGWRLEDYLVEEGYREYDDPWDIGETPKTAGDIKAA